MTPRNKLGMDFLLIGVAVIVVFGILIICMIGGFYPGARLDGAQESGKAYYGQHCSSCHEENRLELKKAPPNLHGLFNHGKLPSGAPATDTEVRNVIFKGRNTMPSFDQRLSEEEVRDIITYLHTGIR